MNYVYFDNAATTRIKENIIQEMLPYLTQNFGNSSSIYNLGKKSKMAIENSRVKIAKALNCKKDEIYFTSGATEANNWALKGIAFANSKRGKHIITTQIEHPSIIETCKFLQKQGFKITYLPVDKYGLISLEDLRNSITKETILVSIMFANNEIGTIQPIKQISDICNEHNIYFHTDAVQAIGKIPIDVKKYNLDMLSLSGHKIFGPKGIGALYIKNTVNIENFIHGGSQEKGLRPGTENVANCVGLGYAIESATYNIESKNKKIQLLRDKLINEIQLNINCSKLNGHPTNRLPGNINFSFRDVNGVTLVSILNKYSICTSSGSACSCGSINPSHVLLALGLSEELASESIRLSLDEQNTEEEINYVINILSKVICKLRINKI